MSCIPGVAAIVAAGVVTVIIGLVRLSGAPYGLHLLLVGKEKVTGPDQAGLNLDTPRLCPLKA
jgi:hypothetical protein